MQRKSKIAIIGGGIGGLAAAIALRQRSFECDIYEQAARMNDIGAGLNLSPNALKAFRALGVEEDMIAVGCRDELQHARNWKTGAVTAQQSRLEGVVETYGASFLTIHRADVQNVLLSRIPAEHLHLGKSCVSVVNMADGVQISFADGSIVEADCVIGADGIHSAVRDSLFGKQPPHFTDCICYRGLVPYDAAKHIIGVNNLNAWWGPHGHVVYYRVRGGDWVNFVAHYDSDAWTEES
jgi:salicylate hydroxylase